MLALIPNIDTLIKKFANEHSIAQLPDVPSVGDSTPTVSYSSLTHSNTMGSKLINGDFSSL